MPAARPPFSKFIRVGLAAAAVAALIVLAIENGGPRFGVDEKLRSLRSRNADVFAGLRDQMGPIIDEVGVEGAIALVERAFVTGLVSVDRCHSLLHIIGHEAYERNPGDLDRLTSPTGTICFSSFSHGVEAQITFSGMGEAAITGELQRYCAVRRAVRTGVTCYHGAGHGFMEQATDAGKALGRCDLLSGGPTEDLSDCYRGVFSEYANRALGYSGDTELPIPEGLRPPLNFDRPYDFCERFARSYRQSCYSQITKVLFRSDDIEGSLEKCLRPDYEAEIQKTCVRIIAGIYGKVTLSREPSVATPATVLGFGPELVAAYLDGLAEVFIPFRQSGIGKDWRPICDSFLSGEDRRACAERFRAVGLD